MHRLLQVDNKLKLRTDIILGSWMYCHIVCLNDRCWRALYVDPLQTGWSSHKLWTIYHISVSLLLTADEDRKKSKTPFCWHSDTGMCEASFECSTIRWLPTSPIWPLTNILLYLDLLAAKDAIVVTWGYSQLNVKCNNDYSVQNDESLWRHCTEERQVRKRDKKVRRDAI